MSEPSPATVLQGPWTNRLLAALPPDEMEVLRPDLETVPLALKQDLYEAGQPIEHVWFPHHGVASLLAEMPGSASVEIATVGPEGMVGLPVFLGEERMASKALVQIPGEGARIGVDGDAHAHRFGCRSIGAVARRLRPLPGPQRGTCSVP